MPDFVLINPETNNAEAVPDYTSALKSGYKVPLNDLNGQPIAVDYANAQGLVAKGYSQPSPGQLQHLLDTAHYYQPKEQVKAFARGLVKGVAGPAAIAAEHYGLGTPYEEIGKSEEFNPGVTASGEVVGTGLGMVALPEASIAGLIGKVGAAGATAVKATGVLGTAGKIVMQGALESGLYDLSHEVSEKLLGRPDHNAENMLAHVGLSTAFGGGLGAAIGLTVSPLARLVPKAAEIIGPAAKKQLEKLADTAGKKELSELITSGVEKAGMGLLGGVTLGSPHYGAAALFGLATSDLAKEAKARAAQIILKGVENPSLVNAVTQVFNTSMKVAGQIEKRASGLFGAGAERLIEEDTPRINDKSVQRLSELAQSPVRLAEHLTEALSPISTDAPELSTAISAQIAKSVQYLSSKIPETNKMGPLNPERIPSASETSHFYRTVGLADKPLNVFNFIKSGTLRRSDLDTLSVLNPNIYEQMKKQVLNKLVTHVSKESLSSIPYPVRYSLNMFLNMDLDKTLSGRSILAGQMAAAGAQAEKAQKEAMQNTQPSKAGMGKMKSQQNDLTSAQQATQRRNSYK